MAGSWTTAMRRLADTDISRRLKALGTSSLVSGDVTVESCLLLKVPRGLETKFVCSSLDVFKHLVGELQRVLFLCLRREIMAGALLMCSNRRCVAEFRSKVCSQMIVIRGVGCVRWIWRRGEGFVKELAEISFPSEHFEFSNFSEVSSDGNSD